MLPHKIRSKARISALANSSLARTIRQLARTIRQEKDIKSTHIRKEEVKPTLFTDNITLYTENLKESIKKPLEPINKFHQVAGRKIKIQKSVVFL